jgi:hypothetical protein
MADDEGVVLTDDSPVAPVPPRTSRWLREWIILLVLTVGGTFLFRTYIVQSYRIP